MFSYSKVDCFKQCPCKYKYRYIDKLKTLPEQNADNPLYLGSGLHKGIELTPKEGVAEYQKHFYVLTNEIVNWSIQIEYWSKKVKEVLPSGGIHEIKITDENFIGFIDYIYDDTLYDFKFSNNIQNYLESPQLSIYKYFWEKKNPTKVIRHLKYVFIPKTNIRQKKTESIQQFRNRLYDELDKLHLEIVEIEYDHDSVTQFLEQCKRIETNREYPKNPTRLCNWCDYEKFCLEGEDWFIYENKSMDLRRTI